MSQLKNYSDLTQEINPLPIELQFSPKHNQSKKEVFSSDFQSIRVLYTELAKERASSVRKRYNILHRPFNLKDFYRICEAENISVIHECFTATGFYFHFNDKQYICISTKVKKALMLRIAFHELGHHFLHRHRLTSHHFTAETVSNSFIEMQANVFAKSLIREVKANVQK